MKPSEQRLSRPRRQHTGASIARHLSELFRRLQMLAGFWPRPDLMALLGARAPIPSEDVLAKGLYRSDRMLTVR
jgi:hypothetical protein